MVSNVLAATAILRLHFRRLRWVGLLGALAALGLVPLALFMPRTDWWRYVVLSLVCLYTGRKVVQFFKARSALKQLSMEDHFLRYGSSGRQIQKCVENAEHMWTRSRILAGLKVIAERRMPSDLLLDEKRQRIYYRFRHAFRPMMPRVAVLDLGLLAAISVAMATAPAVAIDFRAVIFQAGFLALALSVAAEVSHLMVNRQLKGTLERLFNSLSDWTVREGLEAVYVHSGAYSHRLLYFAQPWFASVADAEEDDSEKSFVTQAVDGESTALLPD